LKSSAGSTLDACSAAALQARARTRTAAALLLTYLTSTVSAASLTHIAGPTPISKG